MLRQAGIHLNPKPCLPKGILIVYDLSNLPLCNLFNCRHQSRPPRVPVFPASLFAPCSAVKACSWQGSWGTKGEEHRQCWDPTTASAPLLAQVHGLARNKGVRQQGPMAGGWVILTGLRWRRGCHMGSKSVPSWYTAWRGVAAARVSAGERVQPHRRRTS